MTKLLEDISSPYWWVSIVIVGILINVFSSFIFRRFEQISVKKSERKRLLLEAERQKRQSRIDALRGKKEELILQHLNINHFKQEALENFLIGIIIINAPFLLPIYNLGELWSYKSMMLFTFCVNTICGIIAYYFVWKALRLRKTAKSELEIIREVMNLS